MRGSMSRAEMFGQKMLISIGGTLMAILGMETLVYCVDDVQKSVDYFEDFGLRLFETCARASLWM